MVEVQLIFGQVAAQVTSITITFIPALITALVCDSIVASKECTKNFRTSMSEVRL